MASSSSTMLTEKYRPAKLDELIAHQDILATRTLSLFCSFPRVSSARYP